MDYKKERDYPTPEQLDEWLKDIPKRKISSEEQKKIDAFTKLVKETGKKMSEKHSH